MTSSAAEVLQFGEKKLAACLLLLLLEMFIDGAKSATSKADIENHLELGRELLAAGQLSDALSHYHAAVEGDPTNYLTFFKRGTVYLALGKARFALNDFSKVLELKSDFTAARIQRATVYLKMGDYNNAEEDFYEVLQEQPYNDDVRYQYDRIQPAREQAALTVSLIESGDCTNAIQLLTQLLEISPWSPEFREKRAECYVHVGDTLAAVSDLRSVNKLTQDSTEGYFRLSTLFYKLGHASDSLKEVRECLKLDPEHKQCFPFYKKVKKVQKFLQNAQDSLEEKQFEQCMESAEKALNVEKEEDMVIFEAKRLLCACHTKNEDYAKAIASCRQALEISKDPNVLCDRAEAYIGTDMFEDAIHDYQDALEIDKHLQRAVDGLEKAKKLQKQSERRDYYKILGVKRTATKQEVVKAYRKAAQQWHPDNFQGDEKKIAEKKFIDIAAAKEVLTDPKKREQFDNGQDPLDPEQESYGYRGGDPFQHFHHGSPFQFKFHFN